MSIYWIRFQGDSAAEAMKAVADALYQGEHGVAPDAGYSEKPRTEPEATTPGEDYLQSNLQTLHTSWSVDPLRAEPPADQRLISRLRVHIQHLIRRVTRWYFFAPWLQANEFHAAVVRIIEVLLARQQQFQQQINDYHYRLHAAEQQIHLLRNELAITRQHLMELKQYQAMHQAKSE
ncbi:hypothetical protein [Chloroflexus sp.]|uniref:hypothetical protein n=1 Tax=Chloroflexus sp. TaxID=1904827 RepID=UPI00181CC6E5|nr:hypothetical protein [Chloroflexus sp.]GIV92669.1 MAG: hypothetical protein KatS3mg056_1378 [Chloroflexus sp.]